MYYMIANQNYTALAELLVRAVRQPGWSARSIIFLLLLTPEWFPLFHFFSAEQHISTVWTKNRKKTHIKKVKVNRKMDGEREKRALSRSDRKWADKRPAKPPFRLVSLDTGRQV